MLSSFSRESSSVFVDYFYPILFMKLIYRFSLATSFKSRSKLTDFYKAIHPDKLNNASDQVKEENARSLQILNSYFDALVQNQRASHEKLIFYVPEKSNEKSKKFHPIEVTLDAFRGESEQNVKEMVDKTIKNLLSVLNEKQDEIGTQHISKKKKKQFLSNDEMREIEAETLRTMSLEKKKLKVASTIQS